MDTIKQYRSSVKMVSINKPWIISFRGTGKTVTETCSVNEISYRYFRFNCDSLLVRFSTVISIFRRQTFELRHISSFLFFLDKTQYMGLYKTQDPSFLNLKEFCNHSYSPPRDESFIWWSKGVHRTVEPVYKPFPVPLSLLGLLLLLRPQDTVTSYWYESLLYIKFYRSSPGHVTECGH